MNQTFHRRTLPAEAIAFSSPLGKDLFFQALATGGLDGYFPLAEQFHTQSEPSYCGLASLVVALNALAIDPGRVWKGPWRWFAEDLLDCCVQLTSAKESGIVMEDFACLARCNGAEVQISRTDAATRDDWRGALALAASAAAVLVTSYDSAALGQTGSGHFSPIGGYHRDKDLVLILDVARFKYPPHWVPADLLWQAMDSVDPATGHARGWITLRQGKGSRNADHLSCNLRYARQ